MDSRWSQYAQNSKRDGAVFWHPLSSFEDIRNNLFPITTTSLGAGGATFAPGDEFSIPGGKGDATGIVDTVSSGVVLTYHILNAGTGYAPATGVACTAITGTGTGLTINILTADNDAIDLSPFVSGGSQSAFGAEVELSWNIELFGSGQPTINSILEIKSQNQTQWMGIIDAISSYEVSRGVRRMSLSAKSRDSLNMWRETKRVSRSYPSLTNLLTIITDISTDALGLFSDEISLNTTSITTVHSNTQLAGLSAWDMIQVVMIAMGNTPFVDCLGRLRSANRDLSTITPNYILTNERLVKSGGSSFRTPLSRFRLKWRDPVLSRWVGTGGKIADATITFGWFIPFWRHTVWFSSDHTQRAQDTYLVIKQNINGIYINGVIQIWSQDSDFDGHIDCINTVEIGILIGLFIAWEAAHYVPDIVVSFFGGATIPVGRIGESIALAAVAIILMSIGTGVYEIWGNPFDYVHAINTTEAFDQNAPGWVDNPVDIENDLIMNESHADAVATRELIYRFSEPQKWSATIVDDLRIEYGDIIQFPDGTKMFVEDFQRSVGRNGDPNVDVKGFLI